MLFPERISGKSGQVEWEKNFCQQIRHREYAVRISETLNQSPPQSSTRNYEWLNDD